MIVSHPSSEVNFHLSTFSLDLYYSMDNTKEYIHDLIDIYRRVIV
jgi:hypothetical protein